jgi:hypothetical protein
VVPATLAFSTSLQWTQPEAMSPGEFGGCLEAHVATKISSARRPKMHDNVCKAVVECALWRDPDAGLLRDGSGRALAGAVLVLMLVLVLVLVLILALVLAIDRDKDQLL